MNRKSNMQVIVLLTRYDVIRVSWDAYLVLQTAEVLSITPLTPEPQENHLKFLKCKPCLTRKQQHPSPSSLEQAYCTPVSGKVIVTPNGLFPRKWTPRTSNCEGLPPQGHGIFLWFVTRQSSIFCLFSLPWVPHEYKNSFNDDDSWFYMSNLNLFTELQTHISNYPLDIST